MALFLDSVSQYSGSLYETARGLMRSRNNQGRRAERLAQQKSEAEAKIDRLSKEVKELREKLSQTTQLLEKERQENERLRKRPITLPSDLPLPHHSYGPKMISLCLNLCREVGFRPAERALTLIFDFLNIDAKIPSYDAIRTWACRAGVAELQKPITRADDWIWMTDHSNQVGAEKVMVILGIRACDLPPPGQTLSREQMEPLAVMPGTDWKREDVRRAYEKLVERMGSPRYLVTDGAVELRESADVLEKQGKKPIVLRDMKHFAANQFEKLVGKNDRFKEYLSKLGRTRCQVQQTELSHFLPPPQKPKARFMNLGPTLRWGLMISYHLSNSRSRARKNVTTKRMNEKLGWVRGYRDELASWRRCEAVMQTSLKFINEQGLSHGVADQLQGVLDKLTVRRPGCCELSQKMATKLVEFVRESESQLKPNERAWLSTENLESSFGQYKQLEGQHSKGGFTSLIAAMPALLKTSTPERVREQLTAVSVKDMKQWVRDNLGETLTAKRATAYREFAAANPG